MKTINEWFELIEDPEVRKLARSYTKPRRLRRKEPNAWAAFFGAFVWGATPEGHSYWSEVFGKHISGTPVVLPPPAKLSTDIYVLRLTDKWHTLDKLEVLGVFSSHELAVEGIESYIRSNAWPELSDDDRRMLQLYNQTQSYAESSFEFDIKVLKMNQLDE